MEGVGFELESLDGGGSDQDAWQWGHSDEGSEPEHLGYDGSDSSGVADDGMGWLALTLDPGSTSTVGGGASASSSGETDHFSTHCEFDPPPVDDGGAYAAHSGSNPASRKRQRNTTSRKAAAEARVPTPAPPPSPLPPVGGAAHQARSGYITWSASIPANLSDANRECYEVPLSFETAAYLLSHGDALIGRPRPPFMQGDVETLRGQLFKEDKVARRGKGTDRYDFKGGKQNFAESGTLGVTSDGRRVAVRRSYGKVSVSRVGMRLKVQQYSLITTPEEGKHEVSQSHLFHIVGAVEDKPTEPVVKPGAKEASAMRSARAERDVVRNAPGGGTAGNNRDDDRRMKRESTGSARDGLEVEGLLTLRQPRARAPWVVFEGRLGDVVGTIGPSIGGVALTSGSGDFAEWHTRAPGEKPFEMGEVVSIESYGLSRHTAKARQLGIISRQAVVAGSMPSDPTKAATGDTVAYAGRVMVRLRGGCAAGDYVVPSGLEDGTATATCKRTGLQVVGRTLHSCAATSSSDTEPIVEVASAPSRTFQLVECAVVAPPNTVDDPVPWQKTGKATCCFYFVVVVASCAVVVLVHMAFGLSSRHAHTGCAPLHPPAHMAITGLCDGTEGSQCVYEGCEDGFVMRLAQESASSALPTAPLARQGQLYGTYSQAVRTRECLSSSGMGKYSGDSMVCVRAQCPALVTDCSSASGCCIDCMGGDVLAKFPSTNLDIGPSSMNVSSSPDVVAVGATTVAIPCPSTRAGVPTRGTLIRQCIANNSNHEGAVWSTVKGKCTGSVCKAMAHYLKGYSTALVTENDLLPHTLSFPEAASGSGVVELRCPVKHYTGTISMTCAAGSNEWSNPIGQCEWLHCASRVHNAGTSTRPVLINLPSLSVGDTVMVSCCSKIALNGGCADQASGIGVVAATCLSANEDTDGGYVFSTSGRCAQSSNFRLGLTASTPNGKNGTTFMRKLWAHFSSAMASHITKSTGGAWTLPTEGMLGVLNLQRDDVWGVVATSPYSKLTKVGSINTYSSLIEKASRLVAASNVACRELGFAGASVVMNCQAITNLVRTIKSAFPEGDKLLSALCSTTTGAVLLELSEGLDEVSIDKFWARAEWRPSVPGSRNVSSFRGPLPWSPTVLTTPSSCVGDEMDGLRTRRGTECELSRGNMSGVCTAANTPTAGTLARCSWFSLYKYPGGPDPNIVRMRAGRDKTIPRNNYNIVLGCTGWGETPPSYQYANDSASSQRGRSGGPGGGTWVVGDGIGDYRHDDVGSPKIFSDTQPHLYRWVDTDETITKTARLEEVPSSDFYGRLEVEVDPAGTKLHWSDNNFTSLGTSIQ